MIDFAEVSGRNRL